eukprot:sb/3467993/
MSWMNNSGVWWNNYYYDQYSQAWRYCPSAVAPISPNYTVAPTTTVSPDHTTDHATIPNNTDALSPNNTAGSGTVAVRHRADSYHQTGDLQVRQRADSILNHQTTGEYQTWGDLQQDARSESGSCTNRSGSRSRHTTQGSNCTTNSTTSKPALPVLDQAIVSLERAKLGEVTGPGVVVEEEEESSYRDTPEPSDSEQNPSYYLSFPYFDPVWTYTQMRYMNEDVSYKFTDSPSTAGVRCEENWNEGYPFSSCVYGGAQCQCCAVELNRDSLCIRDQD